MAELRVVTPQEAQLEVDAHAWDGRGYPSLGLRMAYTVATEPERTRAAVVKALRDEAKRWTGPYRVKLNLRADEIENGAPL